MMRQHSDQPEMDPYEGPAGGWDSLRSLAEILQCEHVGAETIWELARQNKPDGFMCVRCGWPKPADHLAESWEEGAKATAWELTTRQTTPAYFERHGLIRQLLSHQVRKGSI